LLLIIVLVMPGGIAALLDFHNRRKLADNRVIVPQPAALAELLAAARPAEALELEGVVLRFGGVAAVDGLDLSVHPGQVHGLIGPNGSGKTTTLNVISGYFRPQQGRLTLGGARLPTGLPVLRAGRGVCRTFQTPRIIGEASVLQNVMVGGTITGRASFVEAMLSLPRSLRDERAIRMRARLALRAVGLHALESVRADRLQHSELRFLEIARGLMLHPALLLLDEPAAGLSADEIKRLGALIKTISQYGVGVLLVEHHADLIFDICDRITVLNLGKVLAHGTPADIRVHKEVVSAYLGA
jgi:branched-chain amino acid transport system permease protein